MLIFSFFCSIELYFVFLVLGSDLVEALLGFFCVASWIRLVWIAKKLDTLDRRLQEREDEQED